MRFFWLVVFASFFDCVIFLKDQNNMILESRVRMSGCSTLAITAQIAGRNKTVYILQYFINLS